MILSAIRKKLIEGLKTAKIENSTQEADLILIRLLNCTRADILGHPEREVTESRRNAVFEVLHRRAAGEPLQYILKEAFFWGRPFAVGKGVLIPRPETELLTEMALKYMLSSSPSPRFFLDWGTGSGCIAITLLLEYPFAKALMAEKNPLSLQICWNNLIRYELVNRALLWHSFLPADIPHGDGKLDFIVSNPPYIPRKEIANLMREVRDHEPHMALDGGEDGMIFYRMLFDHAASFLKAGGMLFLEIGDALQAETLQQTRPPRFRLAEEIKDYAGIPRCMAWEYCR